MRSTVQKLASMGTAVLLASVVVLVAGIGSARSRASAAERPNILFVMTDDQPKDTMAAMPQLRTRVRDRGMTLSNAYVSESLCCPSRASILRGQYPHNTGVERNGPPNGGVQTFRENGMERSTVATLLEQSGYATGLVGKYMNGYNASYTPPGWRYWYAKTDATVSGHIARENGTVVDYSGEPGNWGDRFKASAMGFLDHRTDQASDGPFALFFWTGQPHLPADNYAKRYADMYPRATLDAKPSFDENDVSDKPAWVRNIGRIGDRDREQLRQLRRDQLRSVRQVDDTLGKILDLLKRRGRLNNTYVVFTADNGNHMGEHRWFGYRGAKNTAYEEAANVPMFVRGPGIRAGSSSDELVLNNDLTPTLERIAGLAPPSYVDGRSLLPVWKGSATTWRTAVMNERPVRDHNPIPPYQAAITLRHTYVEYGNGEKELYDRRTDPYELANAYDPAAPPSDLASRLRTLESCAGKGCFAAENGS